MIWANIQNLFWRKKDEKEQDNLELIGYCPVDSGLIMLCDPCYVLDQEPRPNKYSEDICKTLEDGKETSQVLHNMAVVTKTAYGDGQYPVYITRNKEGRISSAIIDFDNLYGDPEDYE